MQHDVQGLEVDAPDALAFERATACFRAPLHASEAAPGLSGPLRESVVVRRGPCPSPDLAAEVARVAADLARSIPGIRGLESSDLQFVDGEVGVVLAYAFPAPRVPDLVLFQVQALRLDGGLLSSITVTTSLERATDAHREGLLRLLASVHPAPSDEG